MTKDDRARIIHGQVYYMNHWVPIKTKAEADAQNRKRIKQGLVKYQGEWITIEEKIRRTSISERPRETVKENVVINKTINRQIYNINTHNDNKVIQNRNEHKHLHIEDKNTIANNIWPTDKNGILDNDNHFFISKNGNKDLLTENKKNLIPPPDDETDK